MRKYIIQLLFSVLVFTVSGQTQLKVLTFNIRYDNPADGEFGWQKRLPLLDSVMQAERPDVIGLQEVLKNQAEDLKKMLKGYAMAGVGRDDGKEKGEYAAVFYRTDRFEKEAGSTFWLSETPEIPGSMSWNTACTRIVTWVKLKNKKSGQVFFVFNTHFDHASLLAREESAKLLLRKIIEIAGSNSSIITGDFNDTESSNTIKTLTSGPQGLENTRSLSAMPAEGPEYTFIGFPFNPEKENSIDFIFLKNKGNIRVTRHRIITFHRGDKYPSDHLPVCAELEIPIH
ncbi:MAG: endonuclease/exonuclease/phosphatase family protein [Bacteroidetes bacterium]|nr:endonuclease/exonuclease/phosphatase family protein [Bacteroidota bacterium]